jgi:regulator of sirC expression with transglutaminase-like and TPR domain
MTRSADPTERFRALIGLPARDVPLDLTALLVAAHDHPVDIEAELGRLDRLADDVSTAGARDAEGIAAALFGDGAVGGAFVGNRADYGDPRNSYLDEVLGRRLGIPITLSLVLLEVGRRVGVPLAGVGMPGHFLVGAGSGTYVDPFHGGLVLDTDGCRVLFEQLRPADAFDVRFLEPVEAHAIVARMLANLVNTLVARSPTDAAWAVRLRCAVPGVSAAERRDGAALLGSLGFFAEAAEALEAVAPALGDEAAARAERDAVALRARSN